MTMGGGGNKPKEPGGPQRAMKYGAIVLHVTALLSCAYIYATDGLTRPAFTLLVLAGVGLMWTMWANEQDQQERFKALETRQSARRQQTRTFSDFRDDTGSDLIDVDSDD